MDDVSQADPIGFAFFPDLDILEKAGGKKGADVVVDAVAIVGIAFLDADIGADEGFADGEGADVADGDAEDFGLEELELLLEFFQLLGGGGLGKTAQPPPEDTTKPDRGLPPKYPPEYLHR